MPQQQNSRQPSAQPSEENAELKLPRQPQSIQYIVAEGDTLSEIANRFRVPLDDCIRANRRNVPDPNLILPGQKLKIPLSWERKPNDHSVKNDLEEREVMKSAPRGIRNNNPGNIIHSERNIWIGAAQPPQEDGYCRFSRPEYGIRAICKVLMSYQEMEISCVSDIIQRWAPESGGNDTKAYISSVCQRAGMDPDQSLDLSNKKQLTSFLQALIHHENGVQPYSEAVIHSGISLAGLASGTNENPQR